MVHGSNSTVCRWTIDSSALAKSIQLEVRPLLAFVDYHQLQHEDKYFKADILEKASLVSVRADAELPEVYFGHNAVSIKRSGNWYNNFEYAIERERGFDFTEDLFQPFVMNFDLSRPAGLVISTEQIPVKDVEKLERAEIKRRSKLVSTANDTHEFTAQLVLAADQFIVKRGEGHTVIAGYPWFSDWGRDTMISLAGLTLVTNRPKIAKDILLEFSKYISEGMTRGQSTRRNLKRK